MASIFKAIDRSTGKTVALKVPHLQYEADIAFYQRFEREEKIGQKLDHPNIVRVLSPEKKSRMYLVMELAEGKSLRALQGDGRTGAGEGARHRGADRERPRLLALTRHRPPRSEAGQRHRHPRGADQAPRLRHRDGRSGAAAHLVRADAPGGDARLHGSRAGARQARRRQDRHLRARHDALRDDHGRAALPARERPRDDADEAEPGPAPAERGDAEHRSEGRGDHHARHPALAARALRDGQGDAHRPREPRRRSSFATAPRGRASRSSSGSTSRGASSRAPFSPSSSGRFSSSR